MTPIFDIKKLIEFLREGQAEKAIPHLEEITRKLPAHVAAHALLAQAYTIEKLYEKAKSAWQNALFLMPNSPSIQKGFKRVLNELASQQKLKETLFNPDTLDQKDQLQVDQPISFPDPETETNNLQEQSPADQNVQPEETDGAPALLVNPSSHHSIDPEEIKQILPDTIPLTDTSQEEQTEQEPLAGAEETIAYPELPVISIPTVSPTISESKNGNPLPVPPILSTYVQNLKEWKDDEELDHLIEELESARIVPKPEHEHIEAPALDTDIEDMVSETLARIYEGQNQLLKAAEMYDKLAVANPSKAESFIARAKELRSKRTDESDEMQEANSDES